MDELKRSRMESALNGAIGSITTLIGIGMFIVAFFPWNIGLLLRGLAFVALGLGYRYLAIEKILNLKLNIIHQNLAPEKQRKLNRFDVISRIFKWLGNTMFYTGMILLVLEAFKYLPSKYLDISIGLEAAGLTAISVSVLYSMNNKLDNIYEGICDVGKDFRELAEIERIISRKLNQISRKIKKQKYE